MNAAIGSKAPVFILQDQDGNEVDMNTILGHKPAVIYFYPKNFTPACTKEACTFRDHFEDFTDLGAAVFGISTDSVNSHARFAKKYKLPFTMLADAGGKVRKLYGVKGDLFGLIPGRETFVIDAKGIVQMRFNSQNATPHIQKALEMLKDL